MKKEEIPEYFLNKTIRLIKNNDFILTGKILAINDSSLIFETEQATAVIELEHIKELILKKGTSNDKR